MIGFSRRQFATGLAAAGLGLGSAAETGDGPGSGLARHAQPAANLFGTDAAHRLGKFSGLHLHGRVLEGVHRGDRRAARVLPAPDRRALPEDDPRYEHEHQLVRHLHRRLSVEGAGGAVRHRSHRARQGSRRRSGDELGRLSAQPLAAYSKLGNKMVTIPIVGDVSFTIWNKAAYRAAGLDPEQGPATWRQLVRERPEAAFRRPVRLQSAGRKDHPDRLRLDHAVSQLRRPVFRSGRQAAAGQPGEHRGVPLHGGEPRQDQPARQSHLGLSRDAREPARPRRPRKATCGPAASPRSTIRRNRRSRSRSAMRRRPR